jgi:hypothetical protein
MAITPDKGPKIMSINDTGLPSKDELQAMDSEELMNTVVMLSEVMGLDKSSESGQKLVNLCKKYGPAHEAGDAFDLTQDEREFVISLGLAEEASMNEIA